jgi:hypothetical protein
LSTGIGIDGSVLGPYAPAVLRFQLSFPDTYPKLPPLILFSTDVFHPLITPLTTYMYTTDAQIDGTVSASDQERLPPGGFSLRHGFPGWFGRGTRTESGDRRVSGERTVSSGSSAPPEHSLMSSGPSHASSAGDNGTDKLSLSIYSVLKYIRSAFDTPEVLDAVPLAAAGNPGAWHAWRTHRRKQGKLADQAQHSSENAETDGVNSGPSESTAEPAQPPNTAIRRPGEWNWDGVWEDRVKKGVAASLSEAVLYGSSGAPDEMVSKLCPQRRAVANTPYTDSLYRNGRD